MLRDNAISCLVLLTALVSTACAAGTTAPAPSFTVSASNVTMPSNGIAVVPLTFTSVNGFVGSVAVICLQPTVAGSTNKGPYCDDGGPVRAYPLTANGTATATMNIVAIEPAVVPALRATNRLGTGGRCALAGVLLLGLGIFRRRRRFAQRMVMVVGTGAMAIALSGCGGPPTLTPGDYVFLFNANSVDDNPPLTASTTATVTVPAGIVTKSLN